MPSHKEHGGSAYQLLQDNPSQNDLKERPRTQGPLQAPISQNRLRHSIWQLVAAVSTVGFTVILALYLQLIHKAYPPTLDCGDSVEEAVSRGCTWDPLTKYWLPAECPRIANQEHEDNEWNYYLSTDGGDPIDITGMDGSGYHWWSTEKEHSMHCAYLLVRTGYVLATSSRVDNSISNFNHTKHCAMFLLDRALLSPTINNITTKGVSPSKLGSC